jgi:hypothetical protein
LGLKSCSTDPWEDDDNDGIKNLVDPDWRGQSYGDFNFTLISPFGLALPGGVFFNGTGFHRYVGVAVGTFGPSFSFTAAPGPISGRANSKPNSSVCNIYHQQG